jgi:L-methionine (R)-S-oxide reductase
MEANHMDTPTALVNWLQNFLAQFHATAGTIHWHEDGGLRLAAAINIPVPIQEVVAWVPNGKGMAGLALQRREPVYTCNLKDADSDAVQPAAKLVEARGAVAIPVPDPAGNVRAVVGIAFPEEREFAGAELERLIEAASTLPPVG